MNVSPVSNSRRQLSAQTLAVAESEHPVSVATRHFEHNADYLRA